MYRLKCLVIGFFAIALAGCGQTVKETLNVTNGPAFNAPGSGKSIVILPFADYSQGNLESAKRRDMTITESLTDRLVSNGFGLPIQEDVFDYLVQERIIKLSGYSSADTKSLSDELTNDWSEEMKGEISRYKEQVEQEVNRKSEDNAGTHGLTAQTVAKIGRHFNADYVVRGRILEYKTRDEASWAPWKKGLLPFVNGGANRVLHGFASSDEYDERNESLTGMLIAGRMGYKQSSPAWPYSKGESVFGKSGKTANSILWATVGYAAGEVSHTSGKVDQAVVQMRIWVQEASTGNVIWTNRVRVLVSPETFFADNQYDALFNKAIDKGVATLVDHFVTYGL
ncbi:MAG: hypothetical protein OEL83_08285 [Desulforhopalus sp.]|nr:hypothetical protein [Desulforhopalus sp.]